MNEQRITIKLVQLDMRYNQSQQSYNKTPAMHRDIFRLQLTHYGHLIQNLPPLW